MTPEMATLALRDALAEARAGDGLPLRKVLEYMTEFETSPVIRDACPFCQSTIADTHARVPGWRRNSLVVQVRSIA